MYVSIVVININVFNLFIIVLNYYINNIYHTIQSYETSIT